MSDEPSETSEHTGGPRKPATERAEPYYIDSDCEECGRRLVLYDATPPVWYDEWWCPSCQDGIRLDWPDAVKDDFEQRFEEVTDADFLTLEEIERRLDEEADDGHS